MMQNTQAFILKVNPKGESSAVLHCFSKDFGKLILIAKGARSAKSPFRGLTEPFSLLNVHFNEKKDRPYQFLSQAEYAAFYPVLKQDPKSVLYGSVLLEILYKQLEVEANEALFHLLEDVFNTMNEGRSAQTLHWYFILRFLQMEGVSLNTERCEHCESIMTSGYFYPQRGIVRCSDCHEKHTMTWELDPLVLSLLKTLPKGSAKDIPEQIDGSIDKARIDRIVWNTLATRFDSCRSLRSVDILRKVL